MLRHVIARTREARTWQSRNGGQVCPPYILKSATEENSFVGILNAKDKQGYPIVVAIKPLEDKLQVNIIQSVYGRENFNNWITKQADNILYKKGVPLPSHKSLSDWQSLENLPGQGGKDTLSDIITDNAENLNPQNLNYEELLRNNSGGNTSELKTIPTSEENATRGLPKSIINAEGLPSYIYEFYREEFKKSQSFNYF